MKKIIIFVIIFPVFVYLFCDKSFASESNNFDLYMEQLNILDSITNKEKNDADGLNFSISEFSKIKNSKSLLLSNKLQGNLFPNYAYFERLYNGDFELGYPGWNYYRYYDGDWKNWNHNIDMIIQLGSGGFGNYHALLIKDDWLKSNNFTLLPHTTTLKMSFYYKFWYSNCSYGTNGVFIVLADETTGELSPYWFEAGTHPINSDYKFSSLELMDAYDIEQKTNHEFSIYFMIFANDPACMMLFNVDNINIQAGREKPTLSECVGDMCPIYRFYRTNKGIHFYSASNTEADSIFNNDFYNTWSFEGVAYYSYRSNPSISIPLYRFYRTDVGVHFYTANEAEKDSIINNQDATTWNFEGVAYYVYLPEYSESSKNVYRFYRTDAGVHFYTANEAEKDFIINNPDATTWNFEGVAFKIP